MIGQRFGRLVVIAEAGRTKWQTRTYRCLCDCGRESVVLGYSLRCGSTKSCGCGMRVTQFGAAEQNKRWTGDAGTKKAGRDRAVRWFPGPHQCSWPNCTQVAERHHKDGNPLNNDPANIEWLCHPHHMHVELAGKPKPEAMKQKIAATLRGRTLSAEQRAAVSEGLRAWWARRKGQSNG